MQASNTWNLVKEKAVEEKEAAAERVTSLKEAAVEKVNSMKENADDGITNSQVRKNSDVFDLGGDHGDHLASVAGDLVWRWLFWQGRAGRVPGFNQKIIIVVYEGIW